MDRAILLTFNLLLTLVVKLPIIAYFFKKRKRQVAVVAAFIINLISWIISTVIWLKNSNVADLNSLPVRAVMAVIEGIAYWYFLGRNWKKALLLTLVTNIAAYVAVEFIELPEDFFQKKNNMIR